jgi:hypothetical protein
MPERNTRNQRDTRRDVTKEHHGPIVVWRFRDRELQRNNAHVIS